MVATAVVIMAALWASVVKICRVERMRYMATWRDYDLLSHGHFGLSVFLGLYR